MADQCATAPDTVLSGLNTLKNKSVTQACSLAQWPATETPLTPWAVCDRSDWFRRKSFCLLLHQREAAHDLEPHSWEEDGGREGTTPLAAVYRTLAILHISIENRKNLVCLMGKESCLNSHRANKSQLESTPLNLSDLLLIELIARTNATVLICNNIKQNKPRPLHSFWVQARLCQVRNSQGGILHSEEWMGEGLQWCNLPGQTPALFWRVRD